MTSYLVTVVTDNHLTCLPWSRGGRGGGTINCNQFLDPHIKSLKSRGSGELPTYPSPKLTLTFTSHLGQNVGLRNW